MDTLPPDTPGNRVPIQEVAHPGVVTLWGRQDVAPAGWRFIQPQDAELVALQVAAGLGAILATLPPDSLGSGADPRPPASAPRVRLARGFREPYAPKDPGFGPAPLPAATGRARGTRVPAPRGTRISRVREARRRQPEPKAPRAPRPPRPPRAPRAPRAPRLARRPRLSRPPRPPRGARPARSPRAPRPPRTPYTKNARYRTRCKRGLKPAACKDAPACKPDGTIPQPNVLHSSCNWQPVDSCGACVQDSCTGPGRAVLEELIKLLPRGWFPKPAARSTAANTRTVSDYNKRRLAQGPRRSGDGGLPAPVTAATVASACKAGWACRDWPGWIICPGCSGGYRCTCSTAPVGIPASA